MKGSRAPRITGPNTRSYTLCKPCSQDETQAYAVNKQTPGGGSSVGRASASQAEGRGFETLPPLHSPCVEPPKSRSARPVEARRASRPEIPCPANEYADGPR